MFISKKRHSKDLQTAQAAGNRLIEAILDHVSQGVFLVAADDRILQPVSRSMATLFRRRDFSNLTLERLLGPLVDEQTLIDVCVTLAKLRLGGGRSEIPAMAALQEVEVRLPRTGDAVDVACYAFDFFALEIPGQAQTWMVRVTDRSLLARQNEELEELRPQLADAHREIHDLRMQLAVQSDVLRCVMHVGRSHLAAAVQRSGSALKAITATLKKPAREEEAFRQKLEAIATAVDEIRREAQSLELTAMAAAALSFGEALQDLRERGSLSGNDFLPLAVRLDELFSQYAQLRALIKSPAPRASKPAAAPAGSLEGTLSALTTHVADEHGKRVALRCIGLHRVPTLYQAAVKNIAIQLIRNAVIHGIESASERELAGKHPEGVLSLQFSALPDGTFEFRFRDDGRGVDPAQVRKIAVERKLLTSEAAARMRDQQAIKLIFKERYSTLASGDAAVPNGAGLSFVRRYVHDAGGKIALASVVGKETRFKISLPPRDAEVDDLRAQVA
jgi:signal transduction histidine kinase